MKNQLIIEQFGMNLWPLKLNSSIFASASQKSEEYHAKVAQLVEHDLAKVGVASSNLVFRSEEKCG